MEFRKRIYGDISLEVMFYNTVSCPRLLESRLDGNMIVLPMCDTIERKVHTNDEIDKLMESVLSFILFCYNNGVIYGDVKLDNVVSYRGQIKVIDFDILYFRNLNYRTRTQTYPSVDVYRLRNSNSRGPMTYKYHEDLNFAIGFMLIRAKYPDMSVSEIYNIASSGDYSMFELGKWNSFLKIALGGHETVAELIKYAPIKIECSDGSFDYHPTPESPADWDPSHEIELTRWTSIIEELHNCREGSLISKELYKRYIGVLTKPEDIENDIFRCCLFATVSSLTMYIIGQGLSIPTLAFHLYGETETFCDHDDLIGYIKRVRTLFMTFIGYRFPSLFRDGF